MTFTGSQTSFSVNIILNIQLNETSENESQKLAFFTSCSNSLEYF